MRRRWPSFKFDRSAGSWLRLVLGFISSLLALSLILAGLNSLVGAPTGLAIPGPGWSGWEFGGWDLGRWVNPDQHSDQGDPGNQGGAGGSSGLSSPSIGTPSGTNGDAATELSDQIQFHGSPEGPALPVMQIRGQTGTAYLRVGVPQSYPNTQTRAPMEPYQGSELEHQIQSSSHTTKTVTIVPVNLSTQLSAPLHAIQLISPVKGLSYSPEMLIFRADRGQADPYELTFYLHQYSEALLNAATVARRPSYTLLPRGITQRTKDLAKEITAAAQTPFQQAKLLEQYLRHNFTYDPQFQGPPQDRDPVDWFLFDEKAGVCGNFNSAFVVMARSLGLPARIVTGYRIDPDQSRQVVTSAQGHAYSEILFDRLGWVTFDATGHYAGPTQSAQITIDQDPERLVAGETAQIEGLVTNESGQPLDKVGVMISLRSGSDEIIIGQGGSQDGRFAIEASIPPKTIPAYYDLVAQALSSPSRAGSRDSVATPVYAHTEIQLDPLASSKKLLLPLNGQLLQRGTEHALAGEPLAATLATKEPTTKNPITDQDGRFATEITFEPSAIPGELPTKMRYKISYPGEGLYLPTEVEGEVTIPASGDKILADDPLVEATEEQSRPWWVTALALAGFAALTLVSWRMRHRLAALFRKRGGTTGPTLAIVGHTPEIAIELPEIEADLPLVWGVDEPLLIQVRSNSGQPLTGRLALSTDGGDIPIPLPAGSDITHTVCFNTRGQHNLNVLANGRVMASRTIKVVSYRDEVIEGGQKLYHASAEDDAQPPDQLTPREFARVILARGHDLPQRLAQAFVDLFELATYSLEAIDRPQYVQFYRACREIGSEARSHQASGISSAGE